MSNINFKKLTIWCLGTSFLVISFIYGQAQSPYISAQSGNWSLASTWVGGNIPPSTLASNDSIHINAGHEVVHSGNVGQTNINDIKFNIYGTLTVLGNIIGKNDMIITVQTTGTLNLISLSTGEKSTFTININGTANVTNELTLTNNALVTVNGTLNVGGNIDVGNQSYLEGSGTVDYGGSCVDGNSGFCSQGPLPVELIYFNADQISSKVAISWSTASELNNDFFTIERSRDGVSFEVLATIQGNGTSNSMIEYQLTDQDPFLGVSYYRLSQTDYDGTTEQFPLVSIFNTAKQNNLSLYPNPISGRHVQLRSSGKPENEPVTLRITNLQGQLVKEQTLVADAFGNINQQIDLQDLIRKDTYIVELISRSHKDIIKVLGN